MPAPLPPLMPPEQVERHAKLASWLRVKEPTTRDLLDEIQALSNEVKQLRKALSPPKSILIVGAEAETIYQSIRGRS